MFWDKERNVKLDIDRFEQKIYDKVTQNLCELFKWCQAMMRFELGGAFWYIVDVLWGQPIKLTQVASNSELPENQWNSLIFFEIVPSHCFGASEASKIDCLKNWELRSFEPKMSIPCWKMDILVP